MLAEATAGTELTVVLPLLHGPMGEDGTVQGMLELANVAFVGSGVLGSALAMDKAMAKQVLAADGVPQARYRAFAEHERTPGLPVRLADELGLPCFVKPANMGSSVGVTKATTSSSSATRSSTRSPTTSGSSSRRPSSAARSRSPCSGTLEPEASVPGEIVPGEEFYSYEDKYVTDGAQLARPGAALTARRWTRCSELAVRVFALLRCEGLARVDFFYEEGGRGFLCNEVNTMPGFTPISMYPKLWLHPA